MSMGPTLAPFKRFTSNCSKADTCTIGNYTITPWVGQREIANDPQNFEHKPKMSKKQMDQHIDPRFYEFGPDHQRKLLLYKAAWIKKHVSTCNIKPILIWQALSHVWKAKIHLQDSMHQVHAHHPWILNIARSAGPWWILTSQNLAEFSFWDNVAYHKLSPNFIFSLFFKIFHVHRSDLGSVQSFHQKCFRSS